MDDAGLDLLDHLRLVNTLAEKLLGRFDDEKLYLEAKPEPCLALHAEAKLLRGHAADIGKEIDRLLIASLDGAKKAVVADKVVQVQRSYTRTWDVELLTGAIAACILQGERLPEVDQVVAALSKVVPPYAGLRVTEIEAIGVDPDKYCEKRLGPPSVSVT